MVRRVSHIATTGRPRKYKTEAELVKAIDGYFDACDSRIKTFVDKDGNETTALVPEPYTMSGLAYAIGLDRWQLVEYAKHDAFYPTIANSRGRVERDMERRLYETPNQAGIIFGLKNYGWRDTQEVRQTNVDEQVVIYRPEKLDAIDIDNGLPEPKDGTQQ